MLRNRNRKLKSSTPSKKANSRDPDHSQALNQNKINRQVAEGQDTDSQAGNHLDG